MSRPLPPKKELCLVLLQSQRSVRVHLDPRRQGVTVPPGFVNQPELILEIGLDLPINIPDLQVDDEGISCTLSFNRRGFWCCLPWPAVFALVGEDGRGMVWPDSVPPELPTRTSRPKLQAVPSKRPRKRRGAGATGPTLVGGSPSQPPPEPEPPAKKPAPAAVSAPRLRPVLAALPDPPEPEPEPAEPGGKGKKLPPYLRVIK